MESDLFFPINTSPTNISCLLLVAEWVFDGVCFSSLSSLTLGPSRRCGRSSSTITTSEITASGEVPSLSLSMSASPTRPAVSCGWIRSPSSEDSTFWCCWTVSSEIHFRQPSTSLHRGTPHHCCVLSGAKDPLAPIIFESVIPFDSVSLTQKIVMFPP